MNDPFVYKDTNILINKLDLKNQELLDQFESTMFQLSFMKILEEGFVVNSVDDVLILHKLLFEEVYDWAGTARTINIKKHEPVLNGLSVNYGDKDNILKDLNNLNKTLINLNVKDNFIKDLTILISKIWQIHPFREGNTRTITVFLYFLLKKYNLELNVDLIEKSSKYFRNSLVLASIGELDLSDAVSLTTISSYAFNGTKFVGVLSIPENVTSIGANSFSNVPITTLDLEEAKNLISIGNNSFTNSKVETLIFPTDGKLEIIGTSAFQNTDISGYLILPSTIKTINGVAFSGAKITQIFIPISVEFIGGSIFSSGTLTIKYEGSSIPPEWSVNWNFYNHPVLFNQEP